MIIAVSIYIKSNQDLKHIICFILFIELLIMYIYLYIIIETKFLFKIKQSQHCRLSNNNENYTRRNH